MSQLTRFIFTCGYAEVTVLHQSQMGRGAAYSQCRTKVAASPDAQRGFGAASVYLAVVFREAVTGEGVLEEADGGKVEGRNVTRRCM